MADRGGRSAQDREAARLERERKRALREGRPPPTSLPRPDEMMAPPPLPDPAAPQADPGHAPAPGPPEYVTDAAAPPAGPSPPIAPWESHVDDAEFIDDSGLVEPPAPLPSAPAEEDEPARGIRRVRRRRPEPEVVQLDAAEPRRPAPRAAPNAPKPPADEAAAPPAAAAKPPPPPWEAPEAVKPPPPSDSGPRSAGSSPAFAPLPAPQSLAFSGPGDRKKKPAGDPPDEDLEPAGDVELDPPSGDLELAPPTGELELGPPTGELELEPPTGEHEPAAGTRRISGLQRIGAGAPGAPTGGPNKRGRRLPSQGGKRNLPLNARRPRWGARIFAILIALVVIVVIFFAVEIYQPFHGKAHGEVTVTIPQHTSASSIGTLLKKDGVISSSFFFDLRTRLDGHRGDLLSGTYHMQKGMSYASVISLLTKPPPAARTTEVTLIPGKSRNQTAKLLHSQGIDGNYITESRSSTLLDPHTYGAPKSTPDLEGFLYPDTYQLRDPINASALIADQLKQFKTQFATINFSYAKAHHLSEYDVLIIASLIEGEAATEHDRLAVSSVIYNRLAKGIPLGLDDTTRFAVNNYTEPLTDNQINSKSPYNTRVHTGLPPTPIDSPSLASIKAAAKPLKSNYLYFVVTPCGNGSMSFTASYSQFEKDSAAYDQARAKRGGKSPENCKTK